MGMAQPTNSNSRSKSTSINMLGQYVGATGAGEPRRHGKLALLPEPEYFHFELKVHFGLQVLGRAGKPYR